MSQQTAGPILIQRDRLQRLQTAILTIQDGAASAVFEGVTYGQGSLATLLALLERVQVKAAIESVEIGNQSYAINGLTYTRGNLRDLYDRDARHEARAARTQRGGIRTRFGVGYA